MKYCLLFLSTVVVISLIGSCKKVETPASKGEWLISGTWKYDTGTVVRPVHVNSSIYASYYDTVDAWQTGGRPECKKDDHLIFRENNKGGLKTNDNKCPGGEVDEVAFDWGLTEQDTKMYMYGTGAANMFYGFENINAKVKEISENKLVLTFQMYGTIYRDYIYVTDTNWYTVTLKKK